MKRIAIIQSSYIPWKGFFDIIAACDEFVLLDDVQFTKRDWRNRNKIKTANGTTWLSVPVESKGKYDQLIQDTRIADSGWAQKHLNSLRHSYARTPFFDQYWPQVEDAFTQAAKQETISDVNMVLLRRLSDMLGIDTPITRSRDYPHEGDKEQRLIDICKAAGATHYLSGPAAKDYIPDGAFESEGITLEYADYSGYPEYEQPFAPFDHYVSVLDLIFCTGPDALKYMKAGMENADIIGGRHDARGSGQANHRPGQRVLP